MKEDEDREFKVKEDGYYFSSSVNYPNNKALVRQNVYLDKSGSITKAEVVDKDGNVQIMMKFTKQEFDKKFDKNYFELSNLLNQKRSSEEKKNTDESINTNENTNTNENSNTNENANTNESTNTNENTNSESSQNTTNNTSSQEDNTKTKQTATIGDIIYPMYLPENTYLTSQETIDTETGQRLILTFGGDSSFILVEETANYNEDGLIIPVSGDFDFLSDVIGVIGTNSISWQSNGIEYYMASNTIETTELVSIARSISILPVSK